MARFTIGRGTTVSIAPLQAGDSVEPTPAIITSTTTVAAKAAVSITVTALPAGTFIPKFTYLSFRSPTGKEVLVQLNADAVAAAVTLTVVPLPAAIAIGSIASFPLRVANRTAANLDRKAGTEGETTFDDDGWTSAIAVEKMADITLPGSFVPLDPAYKNLEYCYDNGLNIFLWLELLAPNGDYAKGTIFKAEYIIESLALDIGAASIIKADIGLKSNGRVIRVDPVPTV